VSIRALITIVMAAVALVTAALFSSFVFFEFREENYKLLDRELLDVGEAIFKKSNKDQSGHFSYQADIADYPLDRYWIKLSDQNNRIIYQSRISKLTDIAVIPENSAYFVESRISPDYLWIDPVDEEDRDELRDDNIRFRVVTMNRSISGIELLLVIAKPIPVMTSELRELLYEVAVWTALAVLFVIAISYFLAGQLLKPLKTINQLTREIRESSLDKRIPQRKNQDELYALTHSLNSMFDRLEHSFKRQKDFVSNASHELKSPLTILRLRLEDLLTTPLNNDVRVEITALLETTQRIQKLVHGLLDISRLEQQDTIHREQFDLTELIREVLDDYDDIIKARNIGVTIPSEKHFISADREKLRRMFINLTDNAIKYNHPCNGTITVKVENLDRSLEVSMANSGEPIPEKDISLLFDQFFRVEKSRSQQHGGTGLGLTIVKKIAELHGGSVNAHSDSGQTTITVILPIT
jgi:two-component system OmpR family sensor kinase